jgi:hypothetical protein
MRGECSIASYGSTTPTIGPGRSPGGRGRADKVVRRFGEAADRPTECQCRSQGALPAALRLGSPPVGLAQAENRRSVRAGAGRVKLSVTMTRLFGPVFPSRSGEPLSGSDHYRRF